MPAFQLVNTHLGGRFRIVKDVLTDQRADVVLQRISLEVLDGPPLRLFALLAPHLVNGGAHNTGWIGDYKGHRMLFAEGDGTRLALGCSRPFLACSVGFVGASRRLADAAPRAAGLTEEYDRAADGNVALTAEIDPPEDGRSAWPSASAAARPKRRSACAPACRRRSSGRSRNTPPAGAAGRRSFARWTARWTGTTSIASAPRCCAATRARHSPAG